MSLEKRLQEFKFNLETISLLTSLGRTQEQLVNNLEPLSFNEELVSFIQNNRRLLNSVLLRLQVYVEQNVKETEICSAFDKLNNTNVNNLLTHLNLLNKTTNDTEKEQVVVSNDSEELEDTNRFDTFFQSCVTQTDEMTDIVKSSQFYLAFTNWWNKQYNEETPTKKELRTYLNDKLGKSKKSTWCKVCLN